METIFDYNPTDTELKRAGLDRKSPNFDFWVERIKQLFAESNDDRLYRLGMLFAGRGDMEKANAYWSQIEHKRMLDTLIEDF
jgi:hypothetical protein